MESCKRLTLLVNVTSLMTLATLKMHKKNPIVATMAAANISQYCTPVCHNKLMTAPAMTRHCISPPNCPLPLSLSRHAYFIHTVLLKNSYVVKDMDRVTEGLFLCFTAKLVVSTR